MRDRSDGYKPIEISGLENRFSSEPQTAEAPAPTEAPQTKRLKKKSLDIVSAPTETTPVPENLIDLSVKKSEEHEKTPDDLISPEKLAAWKQKNKEEEAAEAALKIEREQLYKSQVEADYKSEAFKDHEYTRKLEYAQSLYSHLDRKIATLNTDLNQADAIQDLQTRAVLKKYILESIASYQARLANAEEMMNLLELGEKLKTETDEEKIRDLKQAIINIPLPINLRMSEGELVIRKDLAEREIQNAEDQLYAQYPNLKPEEKFQYMSLILDRKNDQKSITAELDAKNQGKTTLKPLKQIFPPPEPEEESGKIDPFQNHGLPETQDLPVQVNGQRGRLDTQAKPEPGIVQVATIGYPSEESSLPSANAHPESNPQTPGQRSKSSRFKRAWDAFWSPANN